MHTGETIAAGLRAIPKASTQAFASTQAAWRFYQNEAITLPNLFEPLMSEAHQGLESSSQQYGLVMHDWSRISYKNHDSKDDRLQMTHKHDIGYDLYSCLLVSDRDCVPIAPVNQTLSTGSGNLSNRYEGLQDTAIHLEELTETMGALDQQAFCKPLVHIIDREGDSIAHQRQWRDHHWLIRAKSRPRADYQGKTLALADIADQLEYTLARQVEAKGHRVTQWVGEADIVLARPAKPKRKVNDTRTVLIKGDPLPVRLIVSRLISDEGDVVAEWLLLSNLKEVDASTLALWYYWRWKIETFFKLLKQAGHHLESWQQQCGEAVAKRLMIASMACVLVWKLRRDETPEGEEFKHFLVRLSGRQMKRSRPITDSALLAGLWVFLSMQEVLNEYPSDKIQAWRDRMESPS